MDEEIRRSFERHGDSLQTHELRIDRLEQGERYVKLETARIAQAAEATTKAVDELKLTAAAQKGSTATWGGIVAALVVIVPIVLYVFDHWHK